MIIERTCDECKYSDVSATEEPCKSCDGPVCRFKPKEEGMNGDNMDDIRFYIPKDESIPTDLRLYVGENYVEYKRIVNGFLFKTLIDDEDEAMRVVERIVTRMKSEHDESEHGVSWRTVSLNVVPQDERYSIGVWIEWKYRVRDSY